MSDDVKISKSEYNILRLAAGQLQIMKTLGFKEAEPKTQDAAHDCSHYQNNLDALTACQVNPQNGQVECSRCNWVSGWSIHREDTSTKICDKYEPWDFGLPNKAAMSERKPRITQFTSKTLPMACGLARDLDDTGGCMLQWNPQNSSNRLLDTDDVQIQFYNACRLAKQQMLSKKETSDQAQ